MKIIAWNVNGIRAIYQKGFLDWMKRADPDILCLQEIKAQEEQIPEELIRPLGYYSYFHSAQRKGYSGVAVYSKHKPQKVVYQLGMKRFDEEGRMVELKFDDFSLINFYLPNGGQNKNNLRYKLKVYDQVIKVLKKRKNQPIVLVGDFNVAHQEIDLARPAENADNIMFTPVERKKIDQIINLGFLDTFRKFHQAGGHYTWWSYKFQARARNIGWRIDYVFVSPALAGKVEQSFILNEVMGSDHCPVGIEIS